MKKALIIAYYFPPMGLSGVQRTFKFVKYLGKYGWHPTVLTGDPKVYYVYDHSMLEEIEGMDIRIIRVGERLLNTVPVSNAQQLPREFIRKILGRISKTLFLPDHRIFWSRNAFQHIQDVCVRERFDITFVSGPPFSSVSIALKLKKRFHIPFIVDYRDLWYGYHFGYYPTPLHRYLNKKMEWHALRETAMATVTNKNIKRKILDYYPAMASSRITVLPHGFDPADFAGTPLRQKSTEKCVITYSGIFYEYITPLYFLRAFKEIILRYPAEAADMELHFVGLLRDENRAIVVSLGLADYVKELGYLDHRDAVQEIRSSDILWFMVGRAANADTISSGKLYEYFGSCKPIIACLPDGALRDDVSAYGAAILTQPDDVQEIASAVLTFYLQYKQNALPRPDPQFVSTFRRDALTARLADIFNGCVP